MKKFKLSRFGMTLLVILFAFSISNCSVQVRNSPPPKAKKIPPGQAKKMNGSKSAKNYAPGQNK
ncbi:hypothetical protein SAMN05443549_101375 [Flavobacterium fluvii]|uniref:Quinol oxidase subunit 4 n=1 Tax=Flavobacterium fluvii TaxID=468056 RepID=A0A1M5EKD0_9FLAO|nr:hypothetical protein [Flavobacterium fluvii]SHF79636.1 hypothetical protein SAMN05443549_101375 [Flavobacterium fluvii]